MQILCDLYNKEVIADQDQDFQDLAFKVGKISKTLHSHQSDENTANQIPTTVIEELSNAGLFRAGLTKQQGGYELDSIHLSLLLEILAYNDASLGWTAMVGMDMSMYPLPSSTLRTIFDENKHALVAGMLVPLGTATKFPEGYLINGSWRMASGFFNANWIAAGAWLQEPDGSPIRTQHGWPEWRVFLLPKEKCVQKGKWNPTGLKETGSVDFSIHREMVPESFSFRLGQKGRGAGKEEFDVLMRKMPAVALGACRAALDYSRKTFTTHPPNNYFPSTDYIDFNIGNSEMRYYAARSSVYNSLSERLSLLSDGVSFDSFTPDQKINTVLARAFAMRESREIVRSLHDLHIEAYGTEDKKLSHWLLDLETMNQHLMAQEKTVLSCGAFLLNHQVEVPIVLGLPPAIITTEENYG